MGFLKNSAIFILSILAILSIILFSLALTLNTFLYPEVYIKSFEEAGVYDFIQNNLDKAQAATFIAIPESGPKIIVENLLTNFLSYIRSDDKELNLTIKIDTQKLKNFFIESVEKTPFCQSSQQQIPKEICRPQNQSAEEFLEEFLAEKNLSFFETDVVDLSNVYGLEKGSEGKIALDRIRYFIEIYQKTAFILGVIILAILMIMFFLKVNKPSSFIKLISLISITSGILIAMIAFSISKSMTLIPQQSEIIVKTILDSIASPISSKLYLHAKILAGVGIILFFISFLVKKASPKKAKKPQTQKLKNH